MRKRRHCLGWLITSVLAAAIPSAPTNAHAQPAGDVRQTPSDPTENDTNPTRPVFFSIRPELSKPADGITQGSLIFRYDHAALRARRFLPGKRGMLMRFEAPVAGAEVSGAARTTQQAGLGDLYAQILLVPHITKTGAFVAGTGLVIPTATDTLLGAGKWILAPAVAPVWFFQPGMFLIKFQNFVSIGGDSSRRDINFFLITPTLVHRVGQRWWLLADLETRTNWMRDGRTGMKSGLQLGRHLRRGFSVWAKPEAWWGQNQDGRWNLKFGLVWYR